MEFVHRTGQHGGKLVFLRLKSIVRGWIAGGGLIRGLEILSFTLVRDAFGPCEVPEGLRDDTYADVKFAIFARVR